MVGSHSPGIQKFMGLLVVWGMSGSLYVKDKCHLNWTRTFLTFTISRWVQLTAVNIHKQGEEKIAIPTRNPRLHVPGVCAATEVIPVPAGAQRRAPALATAGSGLGVGPHGACPPGWREDGPGQRCSPTSSRRGPAFGEGAGQVLA